MKYHRITIHLHHQYNAVTHHWEQATEELLSSVVAQKQIVRLVLFTDCKDNQTYIAQRSFVEQWVERHFASPRPVVSLVAQPPLAAYLSLEFHTLEEVDDPALSIEERFTPSAIRYLCIITPHYREIVAGGLYADNLDLPVCEQSEQVFRKAAAILAAEEMHFGNIVRQWNYLEQITGVAHGNQCYQDFNDRRTLFYATSEWLTGYPAATGIGTCHGGVTIDFNAVCGEVDIRPLDNDLQRAPHVYSDSVLVGHRANTPKGTPKFERGKVLSDASQQIVYISGTAAIRGEESAFSTDVQIQTAITLENIRHLIAQVSEDAAPDYLRVYLKHEADQPTVKAYMDSLYPDIPIAYLCADVCRPELLVEIEGTAHAYRT
ncbi:MAG: PTS cellobiose transporter subunit IIC [Mediterranea sp.]|nr:PTS cellobiose transporter subunit IIC [Mediterranea sp.]